VIGDAAFIGDTLFAPDTGSARADFPGGDAGRLYDSIQRLLGLPASTRLFLCHDYPPEGRHEDPLTRVAEQASANVHVGGGRSRQEYVQLRQTRDAHLPVPKLLLPSLQVNIRGGRLPAADSNGIAYLRLPLNVMGGEQ
jgi:Zn-dependent hydrolases, including glyoxylases